MAEKPIGSSSTTSTENISFDSVIAEETASISDHMNDLVMDHDAIIIEPSVVVESSFNTHNDDGVQKLENGMNVEENVKKTADTNNKISTDPNLISRQVF